MHMGETILTGRYSIKLLLIIYQTNIKLANADVIKEINLFMGIHRTKNLYCSKTGFIIVSFYASKSMHIS